MSEQVVCEHQYRFDYIHTQVVGFGQSVRWDPQEGDAETDTTSPDARNPKNIPIIQEIVLDHLVCGVSVRQVQSSGEADCNMSRQHFGQPVTTADETFDPVRIQCPRTSDKGADAPSGEGVEIHHILSFNIVTGKVCRKWGCQMLTPKRFNSICHFHSSDLHSFD